MTDHQQYLIREIDSITAKGMNEPVVVYEIFEAESEEMKDLKQKTMGDFSLGMIQYKCQDFQAALVSFQKVLNVNPGDRMARVLIQRCDHFITNPPPADWNGVAEMRQK